MVVWSHLSLDFVKHRLVLFLPSPQCQGEWFVPDRLNRTKHKLPKSAYQALRSTPSFSMNNTKFLNLTFAPTSSSQNTRVRPSPLTLYLFIWLSLPTDPQATLTSLPAEHGHLTCVSPSQCLPGPGNPIALHMEQRWQLQRSVCHSRGSRGRALGPCVQHQ